MSDPVWPDPTGPAPDPHDGFTQPAPIGDATSSAPAQPEFALSNYGVPQYSWLAPGSGQPDPYDPLVTAPAQGFAGWWARLWHTARRSWRPVLGTIALTNVVPSVIVSVAGIRLRDDLPDPGVTADQFHAGFSHAFATFAGTILIGIVLTVILTAVGWAAIAWIITRQAAGQPAPFGSAINYGLRNCVRLIGWQFLAGLIIVGGVIACVLPGLYFAIAVSLILPFAIFERGTNAVSGSWRMVNRNFGAVLGRILLLFVFEFALGLLADLISTVFGMAGGGVAVPSVTASIVSAIIELPAQGLIVIGTILTYTEMRARVSPTYTSMLLTQLDAHDRREVVTAPAG